MCWSESRAPDIPRDLMIRANPPKKTDRPFGTRYRGHRSGARHLGIASRSVGTPYPLFYKRRQRAFNNNDHELQLGGDTRLLDMLKCQAHTAHRAPKTKQHRSLSICVRNARSRAADLGIDTLHAIGRRKIYDLQTPFDLVLLTVCVLVFACFSRFVLVVVTRSLATS